MCATQLSGRYHLKAVKTTFILLQTLNAKVSFRIMLSFATSQLRGRTINMDW